LISLGSTVGWGVAVGSGVLVGGITVQVGSEVAVGGICVTVGTNSVGVDIGVDVGKFSVLGPCVAEPHPTLKITSKVSILARKNLGCFEFIG
jgi:hypothetical protein